MSKREIHEQEHNPDEQVNVQESPADTPEKEENLPDPEAEADGEDEAFDVDGSYEDEAFDEDDVYDEETDSYDEDDTLYMSLDEEEKPQVKTKAPKKKKGRKKRRKRAAVAKRKTDKKKGLIIAGVTVGVLAAVYVGISVFFMSHFYINTEINGHNFSAKSVKDVEEYMKDQVKGYTLTVLEKEDKSDTIKGEDISLAYVENDDVKNAIKKQNAFLWPSAFFVKSSTQVTIEVSYDKEALEEQINNLQSVKVEQIPPTNAYPKFDGTQYVVEPEVTGTAVDMDMLHEKIAQYIREFKSELNMEEEGCYALPKFTAESKEVQAACDSMNQYIKASITYPMDENVVVDKNLISTWLTVDESMNVVFNENGVREWMASFGDQYDTMGAARTITTPWGKTAEVSGGDYGWSIDEETESAALINSIKNGEVVTREPAYYIGGTAASHGPQDWGTTYAEVDLSAQHMWYIQDGAVVLETDVVTGEPIPAKETPTGVYALKETTMHEVLVGEIVPETGEPEYRTPVDYWMRITWSGVGFHDATWQSTFGGTLNQIPGVGSHGCINMPYDQAAALYNMISTGTPVIIHY